MKIIMIFVAVVAAFFFTMHNSAVPEQAIRYGHMTRCTSLFDRSGIGMVYASEIPVFQTKEKASSKKKGMVTGELEFSRRRPKQPIVVYLKRDGGELTHKAPEAQVVSQKNARFSPSFMAIVKGQKVTFDNDETDDINHNVYFLGKEKKDLGVFAQNKKVSHTFTKVGEVEVYCSIHSNMDAKIFVAPNPHFAVIPSGKSKFTLENVPEGEYTLMTYQKSKRFKDASQKIVVKASETNKVKVALKR